MKLAVGNLFALPSNRLALTNKVYYISQDNLDQIIGAYYTKNNVPTEAATAARTV
jgi:hypothetical protein